VCVCDVRS